MTWYVVFRGRKPGVYNNWQTCNQQVCGYNNCLFRGYGTEEEAVADYISYFATRKIGEWQSQVPHQLIAAPANVQQGPQVPEAGGFVEAGPAGYHGPGALLDGLGGDGEPGPAFGQPESETDLLPVVVILVGVIIALVGYILM